MVNWYDTTRRALRRIDAAAAALARERSARLVCQSCGYASSRSRRTCKRCSTPLDRTPLARPWRPILLRLAAVLILVGTTGLVYERLGPGSQAGESPLLWLVWRAIGEDRLKQAGVERVAAVRFPPSTRNLRSFYEAQWFVLDVLAVRAEMAPSEVPQFLQESGFTDPRARYVVLPREGFVRAWAGLPWWDVDLAAPESELRDYGVLGSRNIRKVLVDIRGPDLAVVYISVP